MADPHPILIPRRAVLLGAAGATVLAACGSSDDGAGTSTTAATGAGAPETTGGASSGALTLISMFDPNSFLAAGRPQRAPFTIGDERGLPNPGTAPAEISLSLVRADDDAEVLAPTTVGVRSDGVPVPYYPYELEVDEPGTYVVRAEAGGQQLSAAVQIVEAAGAPFPLVGDALPAIATPTPEATLDVDPICTREPACDLHGTSLDELLGAGRPVALLVATPAFCHTSLCGPTLELLIDVAGEEASAGIDVVHLEVYQSAESVQAGTPEIAAPVAALGLAFEPILFVADASGTVVASLASVMDRTELREALALATA